MERGQKEYLKNGEKDIVWGANMPCQPMFDFSILPLRLLSQI